MNLYAYVGNDPLNNTDPSGNIAGIDNLIGAGVGVGVDLFAQYAQARLAGQPFQVNWTRTAVAAGAGFLTSGASALLGEGVSSLGLGASVGRISAASCATSLTKTPDCTGKK